MRIDEGIKTYVEGKRDPGWVRLIDAGALIAEMHNVTLEDGEDRRIFYEVIERQPAIDPVKHGKWIKNEGRCGWHCSACVTDDVYAFEWNSDKGENELQDHYCPSCGARMDMNEDV